MKNYIFIMLILLAGTGCDKTDDTTTEEHYSVTIHYRDSWFTGSSSGLVLDTTYQSSLSVIGGGDSLSISFPGFDGTTQQFRLYLDRATSPTDTLYYRDKYPGYIQTFLSVYQASHTISCTSTAHTNPSGGGVTKQYEIKSQ